MVRGARPVPATGRSGTGRALRSSFPFGVSGMASSVTMALGTMYPGRSPARSARTSPASAACSREPAGTLVQAARTGVGPVRGAGAVGPVPGAVNRTSSAPASARVPAWAQPTATR